jgi:large subunit ribosomal protein L18
MKHAKRIDRQRRRRRFRVRGALKAHSARPRLSVFRSHKHIYAQIIDDRAGKTLAAASTLDKELHPQLPYGGNKAAAVAVGAAIARRALAAGVQQVAFDRREYRYHGRIAALADAARDAGLDIGAKKPAPEPKPQPEAKKKPPAKKPPKKPAATQTPDTQS